MSIYTYQNAINSVRQLHSRYKKLWKASPASNLTNKVVTGSDLANV
jgi:hypothetical protein